GPGGGRFRQRRGRGGVPQCRAVRPGRRPLDTGGRVGHRPVVVRGRPERRQGAGGWRCRPFRPGRRRPDRHRTHLDRRNLHRRGRWRLVTANAYTFLPWLRAGLTTRILADPGTAARASIDIELLVSGIPVAGSTPL